MPCSPMPDDSRPDIVLASESDFFLPADKEGQARHGAGPMNRYFLAPLDRMGLPYVYHLPIPAQLGVVSLATYLHSRGFKVLAFDNILRIAERRESFFAALERQPAAVGISTAHMWRPATVERLAAWVRERAPAAKIVLGGFGAWRYEAMRALGDVTVLGEGEQTLADLLTALARREPWDAIPNLVWRDSGRWRASPRCPNFSLAQRPAPDWEMLAVRPSFCHEIESSRGCPHACAYCAYPNRANQPMMTRPIGDVAAELRRNHERYGMESFRFTDSTFTSDPKRAQALCQAMISAGLRLKWRCFGRADDFLRLPSLARTMKEAGCVTVQLGLESGSDDILQRMRRDCSKSQMREGVRLAKAGGLFLQGNFIAGFPGETLATRAETLEFIRDCGIDIVFFTPLGVTDELRADARRREDRHLHLQGMWQEWSHDGMDHHEAERQCAYYINAVALKMDQPLLFGFPLYGLNDEEGLSLLRAFRDYYRGDKSANAALREAAQEGIRPLYSKILACYSRSAAAIPGPVTA